MRQFLSEYSLEGFWLLALVVILVTMLVGCAGPAAREIGGNPFGDSAMASDTSP